MWLLVLLACGAKTPPDPAVPEVVREICADLDLSAGLIDTWGPIDSGVVFRIFRKGGRVCVEGWDSGDDEWFEITDLSGAGDVIRFTSTMPSTEWTNQNTLTLTGEGFVEQERTGAGPGESTLVPVEARPPR